jgi:hypothetical protein
LIGVIPKPGQMELVGEFFELFKTPWELYRPGGVYDAVIATADEIPELNAKLLVVYGTTRKNIDARSGVVARGMHPRAILSNREASLPIYNGLLTFANDGNGMSLATASSETAGFWAGFFGSTTVVRLGFDLFEEIRFLLATGQPVEYAHIPTLDIHIRMLREWILKAGIPLLEIPPAPAGYGFTVCLTHDIDFIGIRNHRFDHSMWGFAYRATVGAMLHFIRGRLSLTNLFRSWIAAASLPFVYAGWAKDFWEPFGWYSEAERGLPATYFLIPFKRRAGEKVPGRHVSRRATAYDVGDLPEKTAVLLKQGCELGVHGLDAWHSADKGRDELSAIRTVSRESNIGIRMHWLLRDSRTPSILEEAGYSYDSTFGYNETVGYLAGTSQVFRPLGAQTLLELPLNIQDGALFYAQRLNLSEPEAEKRCQPLIDNLHKFGGVLTLLWHDRSHGPERFWGNFYLRLLGTLRSLDGWFGTSAQVVSWFRKRREVKFERTSALSSTGLCYAGGEIQPPLTIRCHRPSTRPRDSEPAGVVYTETVDFSWNGKSVDNLERWVASAMSTSAVEV